MTQMPKDHGMYVGSGELKTDSHWKEESEKISVNLLLVRVSQTFGPILAAIDFVYANCLLV